MISKAKDTSINDQIQANQEEIGNIHSQIMGADGKELELLIRKQNELLSQQFELIQTANASRPTSKESVWKAIAFIALILIIFALVFATNAWFWRHIETS